MKEKKKKAEMLALGLIYCRNKGIRENPWSEISYLSQTKWE